MIERPEILLAEEDDFSAELIVEMLSDYFVVSRVSTGDHALAAFHNSSPALLLLDMETPGLSAIAVCESIRQSDDRADLPIIFMASKNYTDNRLQVYEAGGNDYITKPLIAAEMLVRIRRTLLQHQDRDQLKSQLRNAFSVAMTAMSSAAEVGAILQFLRNSLSCRNYQDLCNEILKTTTNYGLEASVQIRGQQPTVSLNSLGPCNTLEETILATMSHQGRLINFSSRTACSYEHITLIIKDMPKDDPDRYGRMSDNIALLAEAVNARVVSIDTELMILQQKNSLSDLLHRLKSALFDIYQHQRKNLLESSSAIEEKSKSLNYDKYLNTKIEKLLAEIETVQS